MGYPNDSLTGIIVSIYNLGCFTGCIVNFFMGNWLGRRRAMWFAMVWIIVGATLQTSAFSVPHLMVGRFITGLGTGIETSTVPMYQAELSEAHRRGTLVCSEALFVGVGIVIAYFFDYGMSFVPSPPGIGWRLPIACQMIFAFIVVFLVFGLPESPRYCYQKDRNEEALQILCDVYDLGPEDPKIQREQADVLAALELERHHGDVYFVPTALQDNVGLSRNLSLIIGGCIQTMFIIGSFYPTFFVDRVGRRQPMMWGALGLGISMMMIAVLLSFKGTSIEKQTSSAAVTFFFTYMLIFGGSINCIPWVYVPEILPLHARAKGTAIGMSGNWIWNFFVVIITPVILNRLAWKAYLIFMCTNFAFIPLVYFCYPETANLTLEEIDYIFIDETKSSVKLSKEMRRERVKGIRRESFVQPGSPTGSSADGMVFEGGRNATKRPLKESAANDGDQSKYTMAEHDENSEPKVNLY